MASTEGLGGLGIAIDIVAQRKVLPDSLDMAYYKAFTMILERVTNLAVVCGDVAKLTFDISPEHEYNAALVYRIYREDNPDMFKHLHAEISFASAREWPRLQVGDLMAYEAMKALDHTVGPKKRTRKSWDVLRATERFHTHSYGEDWFTGLRADLSNLERTLGFNRQDYVQWLKERNRHHDMSNIFHFTDWISKRDRQKK